MQLFVEENLPWQKLASAELEEDATAWPRQVLTELFRVLPEVSEYTPDVKFMHVNEEQGYALGVVVVSNGTNTALTTHASQRQAPKALIPIIIKNGKLSPIDTVMSGKGRMYPLTADRLREVLYRPEPFELLSDDWNDSSIWQLFSPPGRGDFGTGTPGGGMSAAGGQGVQYMMGPGMKMAGLFGAIGTTLHAPHIDDLAEKFANDPHLLKRACENPAMAPMLRHLAEVPARDAKTAAALEEAFDDQALADVVLARWSDGAYEVKTANRQFGVLREYRMDRGQFLKFAGAKVAATVDATGSALASSASSPRPQSVLVAGPRGEKPRVIDRSGRYTVFEAASGTPHTGYVFTNLVDTDGNRVPIAVFAGPDGAAVQDAIAGTYPRMAPVDDGDDMPNDPPKGMGIFVAFREGSDTTGTVPLTVKGSVTDEYATRYNCVDLTGEDVTVIAQRGQNAVIAFPAKKEIMIPFNASFVSTQKNLPALISRAPDEESNKVGMQMLAPEIKVSSLGEGWFDLRYKNLPKLASALGTEERTWEDAQYALCVAGVDVAEAANILQKAASTHQAWHVAIYQDLGGKPAIDTDKLASNLREVRALRTDLVKEAAELPDAMTVDAVLSLDFINSENVRTFISFIPYLEKALNRTCELTFASRLGLTEVPEAACARAARGLNDVIRGLKALALRQIDDLP